MNSRQPQYPWQRGTGNYLDSDVLIGDSESILLQAHTAQKTRTVSQWKLADWIKDMKIWPGFKFKTFGEQALQSEINKIYAALSIHMEYYLLHRRELEFLIYSEPLLGLTPHAKLMLSSHSFLTREAWPRIGWKFQKWISNADSLWGFYEYSLCCHFLKRRLERARNEEKLESKKEVLAKLKNTIRSKKDFLQDPWRPQSKLKSSAIDHMILNKEKEIEKHSFKILIDYLEEMKRDFLPNLYKLVLVEIDKHIILQQDESLIEPFEQYLNAWEIYNCEVFESPNFQALNLPSLNCAPVYGRKRGRPKKLKESSPDFYQKSNKKRRGPSIGSGN